MHTLDSKIMHLFFFFQAEDGIRDDLVTGVQTCALPICDRSSYQGYGGNCTPDDHDKLDDEKKDACDKSKGLTCGKNEIDYGKADKIKKCIDARINIARKCFNGGDKGHNTQINQLYSIIGKCTGQAE